MLQSTARRFLLGSTRAALQGNKTRQKKKRKSLSTACKNLQPVCYYQSGGDGGLQEELRQQLYVLHLRSRATPGHLPCLHLASGWFSGGGRGGTTAVQEKSDNIVSHLPE